MPAHAFGVKLLQAGDPHAKQGTANGCTVVTDVACQAHTTVGNKVSIDVGCLDKCDALHDM